MDGKTVPFHTDLNEDYIFPHIFMDYFEGMPTVNIMDLCGAPKVEDEMMEAFRKAFEEEELDDNQEEETEEKFTSD